MPITIDGSLSDWTAPFRLDTVPDGVTGYALYGRFNNLNYNFAISSQVAITDGTTLWLNTDGNTATGYLVFGTAVGAEYNINIVGGLPYLYTGAAAEVFVTGPLTHAYSGDSKILEVAVPKTTIGNPASLRVFIDVNNAIFLPNDYTMPGYLVSGTEAAENITLVQTRFNDSTDTFGTGVIVGGSRTLVQTRYNDSTDTFGTGEIRSGFSLVHTLFVDADSFGTGLVTPGSMTLEQVHFADEDLFWPDSFIEAGAPPFGVASWRVVARVAENTWTDIDAA
jgi:hypothetical protein